MENTELKDRIKEVRKGQKKSQAAFGADLGCSRDAIANYEGGRAEPPETFLQLLCSKFNIREHWLRTGEGPKEAEDGSVWLKKLADEYRLTGEHAGLIDAWLKLKPEQRQSFIDAAKALIAGAEAARKEDDPTHVDIDQELSDYETELKAQAEEQSPSAGTSATGKRA